MLRVFDISKLFSTFPSIVRMRTNIMDLCKKKMSECNDTEAGLRPKLGIF